MQFNNVLYNIIKKHFLYFIIMQTENQILILKDIPEISKIEISASWQHYTVVCLKIVSLELIESVSS